MGKVVLAALLLCGTAWAQDRRSRLALGSVAPPVTAVEWLNVEKAPDLEGKIVVVEFWGTWCGPCVRAMPLVQDLHERYADHGVVVVAISYETAGVMRPWLAERAYTMPVGSDPEKTCIEEFEFRSWPTTFLVDREGKVAHIGSPSDAEPALDRLLGLERDPGKLLDAYLAARARKGDLLAPLSRLAELAPAIFDLAAWAGEPAEGGAGDAAALLDRLASGEESARAAIAASGARDFDLAAWAAAELRERCPVSAGEVKTFLEARRYGMAVDALADRKRARGVLSAAARDAAFREYCAKRAPEARTLARKGLMVLHWPLRKRVPRDNDAFWRDASVSGFLTGPDNGLVGVILAGRPVHGSALPAYVDRQLARALLMEAVAAREPVPPDAVEEERASILEELEGRYG